MSNKDTPISVFRMDYDLSHLDQHAADPNSSNATQSVHGAMGPNETTLYHKARIPQAVKDKKADTMFFKKNVTTVAKAEDHFAFLEKLYIVYVLNNMGAEYKSVKMNIVKRYVIGDPHNDNGSPGKEDTTFWKDGKRTVTHKYAKTHKDKKLAGKRYTSTINTKTLTDIGRAAQHAWQEIYEMLRASVRLYMSKATWQYVDAAIKKEESGREKPDITDANFLTAKNRIKWSWIKTWISDNLCTLTLGSYHFRVLYITFRFNGEARHTWMHRLYQGYLAVTFYKQGWDKIGCKDFLRKCWIWFGDDEKKVTRTAYKEQSDPDRKYKTDNALIRGETFKQFIDFVNSIEPTSFSSAAFKIVWCPEGRSELLYTRQRVKAILKERDSDKKLIKELQARIKVLEIGNGNGGRSNRKNKKLLADKAGKGKAGKDQQPGQQPPLCAKCAAVGLKRRHFVCDPAKRAEGVARLNAALKAKKGYNVRDVSPKTREFPLSSYAEGACGHCKKADQNPKFSVTHLEPECFLRPNGPVQKRLNITYAQMIHHTRKKDWMDAKAAIHREMREKRKLQGDAIKKAEQKAKQRQNSSVMRKPAEGDSYGDSEGASAETARTETARRSDITLDRIPKRRPSKKRREREAKRKAEAERKAKEKADSAAKVKTKASNKARKKAKRKEKREAQAKRKAAVLAEREGQAKKRPAVEADLGPEFEATRRNPDYVPISERKKPRSGPKQIPKHLLDYVIEVEGYKADSEAERKGLHAGLRKRFALDPSDLADIEAQYADGQSAEIRRLKAELALEKASKAKANTIDLAGGHAGESSSSSSAVPDIPASKRRVRFNQHVQEEFYDATLDHLNQSNGDEDGHPSSASKSTSTLFENDSHEAFQEEFTAKGTEYLRDSGDLISDSEENSSDGGPRINNGPAKESAIADDTSSDSGEGDSDASADKASACNASVKPNLTHTRTHAGNIRHRISLPVIRLRRKCSEGGERNMTIPLEPWCPATRVVNPIARTCFTVKAKPIDFDPYKTDCDQEESSRSRKRRRTSTRTSTRKPLSSERPGWRLLQAYTKYRDASGAIKIGRVQLDSHSNVNYSLPGISLRRQWGPNEKSTVIGVSKQPVQLGNPLSFTILKDDTPFVIDTNAPIGGKLSDDCVALLGLDAIKLLGIDLNHAVRNNRHVWIKYLDSKQDSVMRCDQAKDNIVHEHAAPLTPKDLVKHGSTFLSERVIDAYNKAHPNEFERKRIPLESVAIDPDMPEEWQKGFRSDIKERKAAFATHTNQLPKCMNGIEPYMFKVKPGVTAKPVPMPKFGPAKAKLICRWVDWAAGPKVELIKPTTKTAYASRLILAAKYKYDTPKTDPPDGIRVAWAGVEVNETIQKAVPTYPDAWSQIYKVARKKYKFTADGLKQYWTIPLSEKAQEMTAFWTPYGLYKFTRMVMGTKNAATVAQNAYISAMHTKLHPRSYPNIAVWADDFMGGGDDYAELRQTFKDFLDMVIEAGITLNPSKVRVGFKRETWYGMTIEEGKISPSDRNLDPIRKMVYPRNRSELRAVMGVFNQFAHFIDHYGIKGSPAHKLSALVSPKVPYIFTKEHEEALEAIRKEILSGVHLWAQDPDLPLHLETDGSDDGWGAVLFQIVEGERRVIKMWSKKWDTEAWQKKPPYHREAKAWMNGMELSQIYILFNKHPIECYTDHSPLTWVKHTSGKGPVSQFIIDKLSVIDYNMHYIKGPDNVVADGLSRFPMLGPRTLTRTGLKRSVDVLLAALVSTYPLNATRVWLDAGKDTVFISDEVYEWRDTVHNVPRDSKRLYMNHMSEANIKKIPYTFAIWAPYADKVTHQCLAAYKKGIPFACLIPGELVSYIAQEKDGTYNEQVAHMVKDSGKISFLDSGLVWLIHGVKPVRQVLTAERLTIEPTPEHRHTFVGVVQRVLPDPQQNLDELMRHLRSTNLTPPVDMCRTRQEWIQLQAQHRIPMIW